MIGTHRMFPVPAARLKVVATAKVHAPLMRTSCVAHGKTTAAQRREREAVLARESVWGTPVVDYLLETSPYARFLDETAVASIRAREKSLGDAPVGEKLRRLRIAFANKGRKPWNVGKHHNHGVLSYHAPVHTCCSAQLCGSSALSLPPQLLLPLSPPCFRHGCRT